MCSHYSLAPQRSDMAAHGGGSSNRKSLPEHIVGRRTTAGLEVKRNHMIFASGWSVVCHLLMTLRSPFTKHDHLADNRPSSRICHTNEQSLVHHGCCLRISARGRRKRRLKHAMARKTCVCHFPVL